MNRKEEQIHDGRIGSAVSTARSNLKVKTSLSNFRIALGQKFRAAKVNAERSCSSSQAGNPERAEQQSIQCVSERLSKTMSALNRESKFAQREEQTGKTEPNKLTCTSLLLDKLRTLQSMLLSCGLFRRELGDLRALCSKFNSKLEQTSSGLTNGQLRNSTLPAFPPDHHYTVYGC